MPGGGHAFAPDEEAKLIPMKLNLSVPPILYSSHATLEIHSMIAEELQKARAKHPGGMRSGHEGYAVILEELDEVWDEVKKRQYDPAALKKELIQVAAMAIRMIEDLKL